MPNNVIVSLLHPVGYKENKDAKTILYKKGIQPMPYAHAQALGLTRRIRGVVEPPVEADAVQVEPLPFDGAFDEKLTAILTAAGFTGLDHLAQANEDQLRAVKGIGPANFEAIQAALGRRQEQEGE